MMQDIPSSEIVTNRFVSVASSHLENPSKEVGVSKDNEDEELFSAGDLQDLIKRNELGIHFQPIFSSATGGIFGYEALTRLHPHVLVDIPQLFEAARRFDVVASLDTACRQNAIVNAAKLGLAASDCYLFINVCPQTLINPQHQVGLTNILAETNGLSKDKIIFEITEETAVHDYDLFYRTIEYYRSQGYKIAIDDFGVGYGGLKMLASLEPDFVKIDQMFVSGIGQNTVRFNLVDSIVTACHRLGIKVVAEGIESEDDLNIVCNMGIELLQGYALARPTADLLPSETRIVLPKREVVTCGTNEQCFIGEIAQRVTPLRPTSSMPQVRVACIENPDAMSLPVVDESRVLGMVQRKKFFEQQLQGRYGYGQALSAYKNAMELADHVTATTVESNVTLEEVAQRMHSRESNATYNDICVTSNGKYLGTVAISALLQSITQRSISLARGSNPLSGLPGNETIRREIEKRIAQNMHFDVCYIDIDNFKPYNTFYGFERGDCVIDALACEIRAALNHDMANDFNFAGHIGGDDFLILARPRASLEIAKEVVKRFQSHLRKFHGDQDFEQGFYSAHNRKGEEEVFGLLSLSIGIVSAEVHRFSSYAEIASLATEVKNAAKTQDGSAIIRDRRVHDENLSVTLISHQEQNGIIKKVKGLSSTRYAPVRQPHITIRHLLAYTVLRVWRLLTPRNASEVKIMGDKSPKATQKQAAQKQTKDTGAQKKKNDATSAKQAASKDKK